jgi:putative zinc finger protein
MAGHPELEELAALIDGRLPTQDAARVRAHLGSCEECYEVFSETLKLQEELGAEGQVVPFEKRRRGWRWAAAAVAALLVLGVGIVLYRTYWPSTAPQGRAIEALAQTLPGKALDLYGILWTERNRGGNEEKGPKEKELSDEHSFQLGVELLNLQVALDAGQGDVAENAAARMNDLVRPIPDEELKAFYKRLRVDLSQKKDPQRFAGPAAQRAQELRSLGDDPVLDLGSWIEAARLAAIARQTSFFKPREVWSLLARLKQEQEKGFDLSPVEPRLRAIDAVLAKGQLRPEDYQALLKELDPLLAHYYPLATPPPDTPRPTPPPPGTPPPASP